MAFRVAQELHKTVAEIEDMPADEFIEWVAYFKIQHDDRSRGERRNQPHSPDTPQPWQQTYMNFQLRAALQKAALNRKGNLDG